MVTNLPNLLTLFRIVLIPGMVAGLYVQTPFGNLVAFAFFSIAAITDFFDGYLARLLKQQSAFGRFLDPVADKLLVASTLLALAGFGHISGLVILPALVILGREIMVSGLREYLGGLRISVPVSQLAKWKTTVQLVALGFLLLGPAGGPSGIPVQTIGEVLLWIAAAFTLVTGYDYLRAGLRHMETEGTGAGAGNAAHPDAGNAGHPNRAGGAGHAERGGGAGHPKTGGD